MANEGNKVIFFSLEQSKFELVAKGLSRQTFLASPRNAKTNLSIMQSTDFTSEIMQKALENYQVISNNMIIVEGNFNMTVNTIRSYVEKYIKLTGEKPIVVVDYLQILKPANDKWTDKQQVDFSISELKRISRDNDIPIFVICSFNRENYTATVDFTSFKESGGIEYGADVVMGLQLTELEKFTNTTNINERRNKINEAKKQSPREITLVTLKNRNGKSFFKCRYKYYQKYNYFEELEIRE